MSSIQLEILRCQHFQNLKKQYLRCIFGNVHIGVDVNSPSLTPPQSKLCRTIKENFHRWYFDAIAVKSVNSENNNNNVTKDDDPLLLSLEKFFDQGVISRFVNSLADIIVSSSSSSSNSVVDAAANNNSNNTNNAEKLLQQQIIPNLKEKVKEILQNFHFQKQKIQQRLETVTLCESLTSNNNSNNSNKSIEMTLSLSSTNSILWIRYQEEQQQNNNNEKKKDDSDTKFLPIDRKRLSKLFRDYFSNSNNNLAAVHSTENRQEQEQETLFLSRVFQLLLRYAALSDDEMSFGQNCLKRGSFSGLGQHAAVPPSVMEYIASSSSSSSTGMGVSVECFASPLNAFFSKFCSAFEDVDCYFGSLGSFFSLTPEKIKNELVVLGQRSSSSASVAAATSSSSSPQQEEDCEGISFELNPPFTEDVMEASRLHVENILETFSNSNIPISFLIFLPHWISPPTPAIEKIRKNEKNFLKGEIVLQSGAHTFTSGAQHRVGATEYRTSHDSVVFCMQNEAGMKKWSFSDEVKKEIRQRFSPKNNQQRRDRF